MRYQLFKLVLAIIALGFGVYKGLQGLSVAINEPEPTELSAAEFAPAYDGQQYLRVRGRLAMEHLGLKPGTRDRLNPRVAVVGPGWTPDQAVHVVATFGPVEPAELDRWRSETGRLDAVEGQVGTHPKIAEELAPLRLADDVVVVNHGTAPQLGPMLFFFGLMAVGSFLFVGTLRNILRERNS